MTSSIPRYSEIINEAFALNILIDDALKQEPNTRKIQQIGQVRGTLSKTLESISFSSSREESLIRQIRRNNQELGPLIEQFFDLKEGSGGSIDTERGTLLASQLGVKVRFITDDVNRLMETSGNRIVSAQVKTSLIVLILIIVAIFSNAIIYFISSKSIVRAQEKLQESREDLNRAQAVAHIGSWRLNVQKNELTWSDENHRIFGIPPGKPMTYETFLGSVHPEDREHVDREWMAALKGEPYDIEHRIIVDGTVKWVRERAELEFNPEGQLLGGFGTTQDITERKQAEETLKTTLSDLERSNQELEQFAYISSHDLQEPLRKIANFSDMLVHQYQGRLDEQAERYFGYITDGTKRMQSLINDLLNYSRVGRAELPLIQASLEEILKGTLNDLHVQIKENHAEISHDPLPTLKVNPQQMGQLLQNLLINAIKFHGDQPPRIHLSARQESKEWVIAVRDYGIGFDHKYAGGIFKVFKRLHTQEDYPGTGIGLAICQKIVERHGGRIWAESELGRGATFYFTIPS